MIVDNLELEIQAHSNNAASSIDTLINSLNRLKTAVKPSNMAAFTVALTQLNNGLQAIDTRRISVLTTLSNSLQQLSNTQPIMNMTQSLVGLDNELQRKPKDAFKAAKSLSKFGSSASKSTSALGKLLSSVKRFAFYRLLRTAIKAVTDAFKEGSENAYLFSKTVNGELYKSLTKISSAQFKMTNQLGAAWATMLQAIEPVIVKLMSYVTKVAETVTKVFAKLAGSKTYLKAKDVTKEWAEETKKGAKAAKEWKNQLLGFDEINKLDDNSSSGSSGTGEDYSSMFEEVALDEGSLFDFDPYDLGKKIGEKISNAIKSINWSAIWNTLFTAVRNGLDFVSGIIAGIDWEALPGELKRCLTTAFQSLVDSGVMESIGRLVGESISAAIKFTKGLLMTLFGQYIDEEMRKLKPEQRGSVLSVGMAIVRGIVKGMLSIQNEIREGMFELVSQFAWGVADALGIGDALREFQSSDNPLAQKGRAAAVSMLTGFKNQATNPAVSLLINPVIDKLISWLQSGENTSKLEDSGKNLSDELIAGFAEGFSNENTSDMLKEEQEMFNDVIDVGKNTLVVASPSKVFEEIGRYTVDGFEDGFVARWKAMRATLEGLFLSFKNWWESRVVNGFKIKMPHISISYSSASASVKKLYGIASIPQMNVSWYAKGGFPDSGDLFLANENGSAELVGSMNGKTTVANQEQIIEGIKRGVIEAMTQVNGNSKSSNSVTLNVNGKQFCRAIYNDFKTVTTEHGISMSHA